MYLATSDVRRYDTWFFATTCIALICFVLIGLNLASTPGVKERVKALKHWTTTDNAASFDSVFAAPEEQWQAVSQPVNLGMDQTAHWFKFIVDCQNLPSCMLEVSYPLLDELDIVVVLPSSGQIVARYSGGDARLFDERDVFYRSFLFAMPKQPNQQLLQVFARVKTTGTIRLPLKVWSERELIEYAPTNDLAMGVFFGFLCAIGVSNLFLFLTTRNVSFLAYSGYVFSILLTLISLHGFGYAYLWPSMPGLQQKAIVVFANATIFFALVFTRLLLPVKTYLPKIDRTLAVGQYVFLMCIIVGAFLPYAFLLKIFLLLLSLFILVTLLTGIWLAVKGIVMARYFSVAWFVLLLSGLTASLDNLNMIELSVSSNYLIMLGAAIEVLLLALVVAISYSHNRDELFELQARALNEEKRANQAKEELLEVQQRYQADLEYQVEERTLELQVALRELSDANRELENLSSVDSLTGIKNRRHFDKRLLGEGRRSRREQTSLALAILDIDHFKAINDSYGHPVGDACLKHVAKTLKRLLKRPSDDVCRYGGEEFTLILPNTDKEGAYHVVEHMREVIASEPFEVDGHTIELTVSAGIACTVIAYEGHELALLKAADAQLYQAKQAGRNTVFATDLHVE